MNKVLVVFFLVVLAVLSTAQAQSRCGVLTAFLKNDRVRKILHLDFYKDEPIVFVDTAHFFSQCQIEKVYDREVRISSEASEYAVTNKSNIIAEKLTHHGRNHLTIYYRLMQAYGEVVFKRKKKDQYIISDILIGNF
jgi:hypothetical protein